MYFALLLIGLAFFIAVVVLIIMDSYMISTIFFLVAVILFIAAFVYSMLPRKKVKKNRTEYVAPYNCSVERVRFAINAFMVEKEFAPMAYLDEEVYKKGDGWLMARKFIKCTINDDNTVTIEGWIGTGVGNTVATEMNLKGFFGVLPKKQLVKDIEQLMFRIGVVSD